jgi:hypothetical protein
MSNFKHIIENEAGLAKLKIINNLNSYLFNLQLQTRLNELVVCKVRLYVLDGFNFAQRDLFSLSDPYLIIKCGKTAFDESKNYQIDTSEPKFYKCFEFICEFPGAPQLKISAMDYDNFFGDELIGETVIDLDDRYYSHTWQSYANKPIEYRELFHPTSTVN